MSECEDMLIARGLAKPRGEGTRVDGREHSPSLCKCVLDSYLKKKFGERVRKNRDFAINKVAPALSNVKWICPHGEEWKTKIKNEFKDLASWNGIYLCVCDKELEDADIDPAWWLRIATDRIVPLEIREEVAKDGWTLKEL